MTTSSGDISIGDVPIITTLVTDEAGDPTDPPSMTGRVLAPDGRTFTVTPATTGTTGTLRTEAPEADQAGRWWYWLDFNGTADDGYYDVDPAPAAA